MRPKYWTLIQCYADRLPLHKAVLNREHVDGCWNCPHRDLCPDAMTDVSELCKYFEEAQE